MVLNNKCLSCHQNYSFSSNQEWIDSGLVLPGDLKKSILFSSLRGAKQDGPENMPPSHSESLNKEELVTLKDWILHLKEYNSANLKTKLSFLKPKTSEKSLLRRCLTQMSQRFYKELPFSSCHDAIDALTMKIDTELKGDFQLASLRNFQFLHNSFFTEVNFNKNNENWGTFELFDPSETAYSLTASLFIDEIKFDSLFQGSSLIGAKRKKEGDSEFLVFRQDDEKFLPQERYQWLNGNDPDSPVKWSPEPAPAPRGQLVGFKKYSPKRSLIFNVYKNNEEREGVPGIFPLHKSFGGGILGSTSYSILNYSNNFLQVMDNENKTMRSWSKAIIRDYMCRSLPVISIYDSYNKVNKTSKLPFQRSATCLQCHLSIDPTAKALSFVSMGHNNVIAERIDLKAKTIGALQSIVPFDVRHSGLVEKYKTDEKGKMVFRNYQGEYKELKFQNIEELGKKMMQELDPYLCFSKRYLEYFLDLRIDLDDLIKNKNTHSAKDRFIYNELIKFGEKLKKNQSPKELLKAIFDHDLYKYGYENIKVDYKE